MGNVRMIGMAKLRVGAVLALVTLAGCDCGTPQDDCVDLAIDTTPAADATDVAQVVDVVATLKRGMSTAASVSTGRVSVRGPSDTDFGPSAEGAVMGSTVTFAGRMLQPGVNTLKVVVSERDSTCTATKDVRITVRQTPMVPPALMAVEFPQDANGNGTLNATELPAGASLQVRVRTVAGTGAGARAVLRDTAGAVIGAEVDVMSDVATFMLAAPAANAMFVTVQATASRGSQTSAPVNATIQIRRSPPTCMNTSPDLVGPNSDADTNTAGFQLGLLGTVGATATSARFEASPGSLSSNGTLSAGMAAGVVTIPNTGDVTYSTTLIATDPNGNECRSVKNVRANFQGPRLTVASPVNPDGGSVDIAQTPQPITVTSMGLENGRQVCVTAQVGTAMPTQVGCGTVNNGTTTFDLNLVADGVTSFVVSATDSVGNRGETTFTGNVVLEGCVPAFDAALGCPNTYLTSAQVTGGMFAFAGTARTRCMGQAARLYIGATTTAAASTTVGATGAVVFSAAPVVSGTYDVRIEVDRLGGGTPHAVTCADVVVDLNRPAITNPATPTTPPAIINTSQDLQATIAGAQRQLAFSGAIPTNGVAVACMSQMAGSSGTACPGNPGFFVMNPASGLGPSPALSFTFPEGEYQVLVVFTRGSGVNSSVPLAVRVDVTAPCVAMNGFTFPQDTAPVGGDDRLNVAELNGLNPRVSVQLDSACADIATATPPTISIRELTGGVAGATRATGTGTPGSPVALTFTQPVAAVTNLTLFAEAIDWVGNRNSPSGSNNRAVRAMGIYPVLPACSITSPATNARLNAGAVTSGIFAQAQTAGSGVVGTNGTEFSLVRGAGAAVVQTATPSGAGQATSTFATMDGSYTLSARCTDLALNAQSAAPVSFQVDATLPQGCAVTAPTMGQTTLSNVIATTVTTTSTETNAQVRVLSSLPAADTVVGTFSLTGTTASSSLTYSLGTQNLTVFISDDFQNSCRVDVANVNVTSTTCVFTVSKGSVNGPTWLNKTAQGDTTVQVTSSNCLGQAATLTRTSPAATFNATTDVVTGVASFAVTPVNGDEFTITVGNSVPTTVRVDFVDPVVPVGAFTVAGAAPTVGDLRFVAASGNPRVAGGPLATAGYYPDGNPGSAGAQIALAIAGITGGRQGTSNGHVEVLVGGVPLALANNGREAIDADPETITFSGNPVTFGHPQLAATPLVVRVVDQAGNATNAFSGTARVDVIAPADPLPTIGAVTRGGSVPLSWTRTYDDGTDTGSGSVSYEIRWTTEAVPATDSMATEAGFFAPTAYKEIAEPSGATTTATIRLPPNTVYFVDVRARDSLDNFSPFSAPTARDNKWQEISVVDPSVATTSFGQALGTADVTGDGVKDILVGAPGPATTNVGNVIVLRGRATLATAPPCTSSGADCAVIAPFDSATGRFGLDLSTGGNVGEPGEDFVVGQPFHNSGQGRALVYFGVTDGGFPQTAAANVVEIRGDAQSTGTGTVVKILRDVDGDGLDEVAIASVGWDATNVTTTLRGVGRVYIFRGRSFSQWQALGSPVLVNAATWIIDGPSPKIPTGTTTNAFGQGRFGFISLGKPAGASGGNDFLIPLSRSVINEVQVWSASTVSAAAAPLANTSRLQRLSEPPGTVTALTGFGFAAASGMNIVASSDAMLNDLIVGFPSSSRIQFWSDLTRSGASGNATLVTGPNSFGGTIAAASLSDDSSVDLLVNENGNIPQAVWFLFQTPTGFQNVPVLSTDAINFWAVPYRAGGTSSRLGSSISVDDVTGDGQVDVVAADSLVGAVRVLK